MLWFESLQLHNFGPFKGYQEVAFSSRPGVTFIVGQNMRGKTSFLNALRFALLGSTQDRLGNPHRLIDLVNDEAKAAGDYDMRVSLYFRVGDSRYAVTRIVRSGDRVGRPANDGDLVSSFHLERNGEHLSPGQAERELNRIMPASVSRFFLFDGELLQQYEELVVQSDSSARAEIRDSIERVLGVPLLISARDHSSELRRKAEREHAAVIGRSSRNKRIAEEMNGRRLEAEAAEQEVNQFDTMISALEARKREIEAELSQQRAFVDALDEEQRLEAEVEKLEIAIEERRSELSILLSSTWRHLIAPVVRVRIEQLTEEQSQLLDQLSAFRMQAERAASLRKAISDASCPTCGQLLQDPSKIVDLERKLAEIETDTHQLSSLSDRAADTHAAIRVLQSVLDDRSIAEALRRNNEIEGLQVDRSDLDRRLQRVRETIQGRDGVEVTSLQRELQDVIESIGINRSGRSQAIEKAAKARSELRAARDRLPESDETEQIRYAKAYTNATTSLEGLFGEAVGYYRDELRKEVERRSSTLFRELTTEPDYVGLEINQDYGLRIVRRGGTAVTIRSAGAEHLVALSLIAALQACSPRPGPIFVDSPLFRLDDEHRRNVLCALPGFTQQVVLLAFRAELNIEMARSLLGPALVDEYHLERRTSAHTEIVKA